MAKTFVWAGQQFTTAVDPTGTSIPQGALLEDIGTKADRLKCHWNNPSNWREVLPGVPGGASAGLLEDYETYKEVSNCPGGGDDVIFKPFYIGTEKYPKSPCLFGGFWGDEGWLNAETTTGRLKSLVIDKSWGVPVASELQLGPSGDSYTAITEPETEDPWDSAGVRNAEFRIGLFSVERAEAAGLPAESLGYDFPSGISMSGLKLNIRNLRSECGESRTHILNLVGQDSISNFLQDGGFAWYEFFGGTINQLFVQGRPYTPVAGEDPGPKRTNATLRFKMTHDELYGVTPGADPFRANVTGYAYMGEMTSSLERAYSSNFKMPWVWLDSDFSIPNIVIDHSIRPAANAFNVNADKMTIFPEYGERDATSIKNFGFEGIRIGIPVGYREGNTPGASCDIGTLIMQDHPSDDTRKTIPLGGWEQYREESEYLAFSDIKICGANNIVSWEGEGKIGTLKNYGGRFCLGRRYRWMMPPQPFGSPIPYEITFCGLREGNEVEISSGVVYKNTVLDLRNPSNPLYRDIIVGNGVSLPDASVGLQFASPEAITLYPLDSRLVMGYESAANDGDDDDGTIEVYTDQPIITAPPSAGDILKF